MNLFDKAVSEGAPTHAVLLEIDSFISQGEEIIEWLHDHVNSPFQLAIKPAAIQCSFIDPHEATMFKLTWI